MPEAGHRVPSSPNLSRAPLSPAFPRPHPWALSSPAGPEVARVPLSPFRKDPRPLPSDPLALFSKNPAEAV